MLVSSEKNFCCILKYLTQLRIFFLIILNSNKGVRTKSIALFNCIWMPFKFNIMHKRPFNKCKCYKLNISPIFYPGYLIVSFQYLLSPEFLIEQLNIRNNWQSMPNPRVSQNSVVYSSCVHSLLPECQGVIQTRTIWSRALIKP